MSKKTLFSFFCILLTLCLTFTGCQNNDQPNGETNSTESGEIEADTSAMYDLVKDGRLNLKIVIPADASASLTGEVDKLRNALNKITGARLSILSDTTSDGTPIDSTGELIIGDCLRTASREVLSSMKYKDYALKVTDSNIIIAAYEENTLKKAIQAFCKLLDDSHIEKNGNNVTLKWDGNITNLYQGYSETTLTVGGVDAGSYRIVYPAASKEWKSSAYELRNAIGNMCGAALTVVSDKTEETQFEILLGETKRPFSKNFYSGSHAPGNMQYAVGFEEGKLQIASGGLYSVAPAMKAIYTLMVSANGELENLVTDSPVYVSSAAVKECTADYRLMSYNILNGDLNWGADGVTIPYEEEIRVEIVASIIEKYQPDVIGFQEVFDEWSGILTPAISDTYNFVDIQREDGRNCRVRIAYNKARLKPIDSGYAIYPIQDINNRMVVWALFEDLQTGDRFIVMNTHLSAQAASGNTLESQQLAEIEVLLGTLGNIRSQYEVPIALTGDFNCRQNSLPLNTLISGSAFSYATSNWVDQIFYSAQLLTLVYSETIFNHNAANASDHRPLIFDFNLK